MTETLIDCYEWWWKC